MPWTPQQEAHLQNLFRTKKAAYEPDKADGSISASVIKAVWDDPSNSILQVDYKIKNFYPLYRRKAAEFLCNQQKTGARRNRPPPAAAAASPSGAEAEEAESSPEPEQKQPPAYKTDQTENLAAGFGKMTLIEAVSVLKLPVLIYQYKSTTGYTFVTADVLLLSGACINDIHVEIDATGQFITLWVKIPETFLAVGRIHIEDAERGKQSLPSKGAALVEAVTDLRKGAEKFDGWHTMKFKFKLPVTCKTIFAEKPFIAMYPNDYKAECKKGDSSNYKVLHIDLEGLVEPEETRKNMREGKSTFQSPLNKSLDSDGSSDDGDDYGGGGDGDGDATMHGGS